MKQQRQRPQQFESCSARCLDEIARRMMGADRCASLRLDRRRPEVERIQGAVTSLVAIAPAVLAAAAVLVASSSLPCVSARLPHTAVQAPQRLAAESRWILE